MKNKTILALFAIFLIAGSVAAVCAADATLGNLKFEVPDDYNETDSNATSTLLKDDKKEIKRSVKGKIPKKEILITTDIIGDDAIDSYLSAKGFKFNESSTGNTTTKGNDLSGSFSFNSSTYSKDKGYAVAYLLVKDNKNITVIGIDNDFDSDDDFGSSDIDQAVDAVVKQVMLRK